MGIKPLDMQINILQMNNAAAELNKQKGSDINNQNYAASMIEKASLEKGNKIEETDHVESSLPLLDNDVTDNQNQQEGQKKQKKQNFTEDEKEGFKLFEDPAKGHFIDIKE